MLKSINQNPGLNALPNFRSLGVMLRIVLLVNAAILFVALAEAASWKDVLTHLLGISTLAQPSLLIVLLLLYFLAPLLTTLAYMHSSIAVVMATLIVTLAVFYFELPLNESMQGNSGFHALRYGLLSTATALLLLFYFRIRTTQLTPALQDARLQALQARIRPHFLFNTINAVLGIIRSNPRGAETALEDMSDLFRMAMSQSGELVPIRNEIELSRQYLALEQLRLGDRLRVHWHIADLPDDALMPPLVIQPLLENAVYHGIEPMEEGGDIEVRLHRLDNEIHLEMRNPRIEHHVHRKGNKIALANIRERLSLLFDIEASYKVLMTRDSYEVDIVIPYVNTSPSRGATQ